MFFYTYVSSAVKQMTHDDLLALLDESRAWNAVYGITGILLYKDGTFMQLIEGREEDVRLLVNRIARDPRHTAMAPLIDGHESERHYPDWSMAFPDLSDGLAQSYPGYSTFLQVPVTREGYTAKPRHAYKLLLAFKRYFGRELKRTGDVLHP